MTNTTVSYNAPAPNDKPDVLNPLPDGTIYMAGTTNVPPESTIDIAQFPSPILPYFTNEDDCLNFALERHGLTSADFVRTICGGQCRAYKIVYKGTTLYIYIWAVSPAPSRKSEVQP